MESIESRSPWRRWPAISLIFFSHFVSASRQVSGLDMSTPIINNNFHVEEKGDIDGGNGDERLRCLFTNNFDMRMSEKPC